MMFRLLPRLLLAAQFVSTAGSALCQTVYHGEEGRLPLALGGGVSNFDPDFAQNPFPPHSFYTGFGQGRVWGATGWADVGIRSGPDFLHGFNIELQYRATFAGALSAGQNHLTMGNYGGGPTYTFRHFRSFRPYGKFIMNYGTIAFAPTPYPGHPDYSHDSRFAFALGGGFDYRLTSHIWARADYEYQLWGKLFGDPQFSPQGVTVGAMYHLTRPRILH
ncbi:MAG: outer membrane beta-barrel protein [Terracidiphilus sp.]|nr:outer membrane beta-barrel protein [Terracidiphilus sp.]